MKSRLLDALMPNGTKRVLMGMLASALLSVGVTQAQCTADAGTLSGFKPTDCLQSTGAMIGGIPNGDAVVPAGYSTIYVLTEGAGLTIEQVNSTPIFTVNAIGDYTVHTLVYDPNTLDLSIVVFGTTTGFDVNGLLIQGGGSICASLDVAGTSILVDNPDAGAVTADADSVCLNAGSAMISATPDGSLYAPTGYSTIYVLTEGSGLTIVDAGPTPSFTVSNPGDYTIHTLVYDPATLALSVVQFGVTTGFDVNGLLIQGGGGICAALDVAGAPVHVANCASPCTANAGTISADDSSVCTNDNGMTMISATPDGNASVPAGYSTVYVLTQGSGLTIVNAGASPSFMVADTGSYIIHTLVYDPATLDLNIVVPGVTTGFDVNGLLIQGGGTICASLDVAGAPISVVDCPPACVADAGSITADDATVCQNPTGTVTLSATPDGNAVVPTGYTTVYVLTQGAGLVIQNAGPNPSFAVSDSGNYIIHTLVFDASTLDLNTVVPGVTTGFDVNGLLIQGGGSICGSLDVAGAPVSVVECPPVCNANAGTISADDPNICQDASGMTMISATPDGNDNVPAGYSTVYVLTQGSGLTIVNAGASPSFMVSDTGNYIIHTLVYDPATLDLNIVVPGVTTGFDVNGLLIQGGGTICASLDVTGAPVSVVDCSSACAADAGTITADNASVCQNMNGMTTVSATPDGNDLVPAGYSTVYVLTQGAGLTIVNAGASPSFMVADTGDYIIHTLVYDPATLDLNIVVPGVTTGFDVNGLLIQGGGTICASLDVAGAPVSVVDCVAACTADAGTITSNSSTVCLDDTAVWIMANPDGNAVVPAGYNTLYVLTQGTGLVIANAGLSPMFQVSDTGLYTIHTLILDTATLDLSIVVPGVTTGVDVNGLLIQGGGTICASLDVAGAPTMVVNCPIIVTGTNELWFSEPISTWPNPSNGQVTLAVEHIPAGSYQVIVHDLLGAEVAASFRFSQDGLQKNLTLDLSGLREGNYMMNVVGKEGRQCGRIQLLR